MQEGTNNGEDKHLNRERADKYKLSYSTLFYSLCYLHINSKIQNFHKQGSP